MISPALRKKINNAGDIIALCIGVFVLIHVAAFLIIILSLIVQLAFHYSAEFWIFFYDFFSNGLELPDLPEVK